MTHKNATSLLLYNHPA